MFQVYADSHLIYDGRLDEYVLTKAQVSLEVNRSGSFTFTMYKDHPFFSQIEKLKTLVTVYRDGVLVFRGRVIKSADGFYGDKTFTCEGELSFLLDSIQRPWAFTGTPEGLFQRFITAHNAQVGADKQFTLGEVTVTDPNNYINRSNSAYEDTLTNLSSRLVDSLGGYINITPGEHGDRIINWISDFSGTAAQSIEFGENLLDFKRQNSAEDIATALVPLGAILATGEDVDDEVRVTIESVNSGLDYIYDQEAVDKYGWIFKVVTWDDVTVPANLLTKARAHLNELINLNISIELSAVDLSNMDKDIDAFYVGDYIRVVSAPHGIDARYLLTKQTIDLLHPESSKITLGYTFSTFTDRTLLNTTSGASIAQKVDTIESNYVSSGVLTDELSVLRGMIYQTADSITMGVLQEYATNDDVTQAVTTLRNQLMGSLEAVFITVTGLTNDADRESRLKFGQIRQMIRFDNGDIVIGDADAELRIRVQGDKISIMDGADEVAYVSGHKLTVTKAGVLTSLEVGNYGLIAKADGRLSVQKVR